MNELEQTNKLLKKLVQLLVAMLPAHEPTCYGLKVHPSNRERCCNCDMNELRESTKEL